MADQGPLYALKADGMSKRTKQSNDFRRHLSDVPYSVDCFARKHDFAPEQARDLFAEGWAQPR
jgi:hypothetical protein